MSQKVKLTKIPDPFFGPLEPGTEIIVRVPDELDDFDARVRAMRMFKRDNMAENEMEWKAEVVPK